MKKLFLVFSILTASITVMGQQPIPVKPRILISTDIGGTDPDDNQSMAHFLMYSEMFETEGLVSSPSYGHGSKQNLLDMIDLYEKDLPKLKKHIKGFPSPEDKEQPHSKVILLPQRVLIGSLNVPEKKVPGPYGYSYGADSMT